MRGGIEVDVMPLKDYERMKQNRVWKSFQAMMESGICKKKKKRGSKTGDGKVKTWMYI